MARTFISGCKELQAGIAKMPTALAFRACAMLVLPCFAGCFHFGGPDGVMRSSITKSALSGVALPLAFEYAINPDCSSRGLPTLRVLSPPNHGTVNLAPGSDFTTFGRENQRYDCNKNAVAGVHIVYTSSPGYVGDDHAEVEVISPDGFDRITSFQISVK